MRSSTSETAVAAAATNGDETANQEVSSSTEAKGVSNGDAKPDKKPDKKAASPKKKRVKKEKKPPPPVVPPKTTMRGEIVRKQLEEAATVEKAQAEKLRQEAQQRAEEAKKKREEKLAKMRENGQLPPEEEEKKEDKKPVKKTIPRWATLSTSSASTASSKVERPKGEEILMTCINKTSDHKGVASMITMRKYAKKKYPDWPKSMFKKTLQKALDKKTVTQVKGKGLNGWFKIAAPTASSSSKKGGKKSAVSETPKVSLDDMIPHLFTWVCEPKEASATMIKKYIINHYPKLKAGDHPKAFRKAIESGVAKGQLERITGKGASGTFGLIDKAKKTGTTYEDAIEDAIIASNEPKDASIPALRHYLSEWNLEYKIAERPKLLKQCLERCEAKGHITRITGKGFSGTFRLAFPYIPSPKDLWKDAYEGSDDEDDEDDYERQPKKKKSKYVAPSSDEDESEEEEERYVPRPKKSAAKKRAAPPAKKVIKPKVLTKAAKKEVIVAVKSKPPPIKQPAKKVAAKKSASRKRKR